MDQAGRGKQRRQGDVDAFAGELGIECRSFQRRLAGFDCRGDCVLGGIDRRPAFAPLVGRQRAQALEFLGQAAGFAQHADADRIPGAQIGRGSEGGVGGGGKGEKIITHGDTLKKKGCPFARAAP